MSDLNEARQLVRILQAEAAQQQRVVAELTQSVTHLRSELEVQGLASDTLIEEVQSQQKIIEQHRGRSTERNDELFSCRQQLALLRHQNTEMSSVIARLTREVRVLRAFREDADAHVAAFLSTCSRCV